jgi:hypothetical protein
VSEQPNLLLGPLLRWVDDTSATVWVETSCACEVEVLAHTTPTFQIEGHHYALVIVEGLAPGSTTPYEVHLDGRCVWPETSNDLAPSVIRTTGVAAPVRILLGSCRAAAPHEVPYTQELAFDPEGRGVDTLWAHAQRMMVEPVDRWPTLVVFAGDQIYADDSSPRARERIEARRTNGLDLDVAKVFDFEEYCWLYEEAWSSTAERWLLSTVPSAMIFDDHDMIDDWNISTSWLHDMASDPTWSRRAVDGYMSYWVYQHLGNLSPRAVRDDDLLQRLLAVDDGTGILREWAQSCVDSAGSSSGIQFSHVRHVDDVTVITIDCRNGRVLDGGQRLMVQQSEWARIVDAAHEAPGHVMFVTSLPVFIANGIHDLHTWSERVCDAGTWGRWGRRLGERVRRSLDLEDWPAFPESFAAFDELISSLRASDTPPASIVVASGDIHFSYAARVDRYAGSPGPDVWQIVSSPIRNALIPHERGAMRFAITRGGGIVGALLRRASRGADTRPAIAVEAGPYFANNMCVMDYRSGGVVAVFEQSTSSDTGDDPSLHEVGRVDLAARRSAGT